MPTLLRRLLPGFLLSCLAVVIVLTAGTGAAFADKRRALVIGNDRYPNLPANGQLQKAVNDADTIAASLKALGFEVIVGTNLGRQGMVDKLAELTSRLEPGDTAAFFFAGHGVAIGGVNYLLPSDVPAVAEGAEARVRGASLSEPEIISELQAKSVRVALLVIDACRDNPFPRTAGRSLGGTRGLTDAKPARGVFTIYSAGIGQSALDRLGPDDTAKNSVFTRIFAEQMMRPGMHLGDLAVEVRERVAVLALKAKDERGQAVAHEQTPAYYDQTLGRIFLAGQAPVAAAAASLQPAAPAVAPPAPPPQQQAALPPVPTITRTLRPGSPGESCARNGAETYCVSSVLPSQFGNSYGPSNLFRGSESIAWVEGRSGQGVGEWITVEFDDMRSVTSILMRNGYQKNFDIFQKNSRVRQLRVQFSGGQSIMLSPQDQFNAQLFKLDQPVRAHWVKFTIDAVYAGNKYTDTAISKLIVNSEPAR